MPWSRTDIPEFPEAARVLDFDILIKRKEALLAPGERYNLTWSDPAVTPPQQALASTLERRKRTSGIHGWFCPQCPSDQWSGHRRSVVGSPIKICDDCEGLLVLVGQETSAAVPPVAPVPTAAPLTFRSRADTGVGVASGADTGVASTTIGGPPCILELVAAQSCIDDNNDTQVDNDTQVYNDEVDNDTQVYNDAQVDNDTQVYNDAQVDNDDTQVDNDAGDAQVDNDAADDDLSQATQCDRCDGWARRCACPPIDQVIPAMGLPIAIVGIESDTEDEPPPSSRHGGEDKLHF